MRFPFGDSGKRVCLVCTGALTNAALLILLYPEIISMVDIVIMGGCIGVGNTGPVAEFNIQVNSIRRSIDASQPYGLRRVLAAGKSTLLLATVKTSQASSVQ
jgi:NADH:ubiquinone oxidoreductase subunit 6 (subunit J)